MGHVHRLAHASIASLKCERGDGSSIGDASSPDPSSPSPLAKATPMATAAAGGEVGRSSRRQALRRLLLGAGATAAAIITTTASSSYPGGGGLLPSALAAVSEGVGEEEVSIQGKRIIVTGCNSGV